MRALIVAALALFACAAFGEPRAILPPVWKDDLPEMLERRLIRFAVPYSRTLYFNDGGREFGLSAQLARDFGRYLNRKYRKQLGPRPLAVRLLPTAWNDLLPDIVDGFADVAAGNLMVTESRAKQVDFVPWADGSPNIEVVLTRIDGPAVASVEDLAGRTVHVRKSSSYYVSLQALNDRLRKEGRAPVKIVLVPEDLEDEDMMEMLNAGMLQVIVVDDWKAARWVRALPRVKVNDQAAVGTGGIVGWAIRKDNPVLRAELDAFFAEVGRRPRQTLPAAAMQGAKRLGNNLGTVELQRLQDTLPLFRKYGEQYGFDPLMLAAQAYQLSRLDQRMVSAYGAVGIMQIMPATGAAMKVGNVRTLEPNIHATAKYMDQMMARYFEDADFSETNRNLFAIASYHAGAPHIAKVRAEAERRGLDPNQWFNNVEIIATQRLGVQTTAYVRNVYKYYIAYAFALDERKPA
jgi:membrane-bound lytic murein transglycosylase MltF